MARWRESQSSAEATRSPPPPLATPRADAQRAEAIRLAERSLEEHVEFAGAPQALLVAGVDADRIGRRKEAARALGSLVRTFPRSPHAAEAWLALGEHHLGGRDLTKARAAFETAARDGSAGVVGWAAARLAEVALAASDGEGVLDELARALAARSARGLALLDRLAAAPGALASERPILARLADLCDRTGDMGRAVALRERLGSEQARRPSAARRDAHRERRLVAPVAAGGATSSAAANAVRLRPSGAAPGVEQRASLRLAAFGGDAEAIRALGLAALDGGNPAEARALFQRALAAGGAGTATEPLLRNDLGVALAAQGDVAAARVAVARAVEQDPALGVAQENLAALSPPPEAPAPVPQRGLGLLPPPF